MGHLRGDPEDNGVGDLAGGAGDEDALGLVTVAGGGRGHGARSDGSGNAVDLVEGSGEHRSCLLKFIYQLYLGYINTNS